LKCWEADLLIELHRLGHLADMQGVGSQFVKRHRWFPFHRSYGCDHLAVLPSLPKLPNGRGARGQISAASDPCTNLTYRTTSAEPNARTPCLMKATARICSRSSAPPGRCGD